MFYNMSDTLEKIALAAERAAIRCEGYACEQRRIASDMLTKYGAYPVPSMEEQFISALGKVASWFASELRAIAEGDKR